MNLFEWAREFETGLPEVDRQHHEMVDTLATLGELLRRPQLESARVREILGEILLELEQNFRDEESLMAIYAIDRRHRVAHLKQHEDFEVEIAYMVRQLDFREDESGLTLLQFLNNWLVYHLLGHDKSLTRQIAAIKSGQNPEQAYLDEKEQTDAQTSTLLEALSNLFRQMAKRNRQLIEMNRTLEDKVVRRTRALSEANRNLEQLAMTDVLTGLPNRRHALRRTAQMWEDSLCDKTELSCMMIDADNFKYINDGYGHNAGDQVLEALAQRLRQAVRIDDLVCRLGGDEFLVICPRTPLEGAIHLAEIVRKSVALLSVKVGDGLWQGSVSIGVASRIAEMVSPEEMIRAADESVYAAKHAGRNCTRALPPKLSPLQVRPNLADTAKKSTAKSKRSDRNGFRST